ncbi:cytochrome c biogenesis CcdA family protein [Pararhodobacter sp. CCB-MM2]|uniref:cytochrome c biogenesis CcdA family protein n=1 Tax=Pararhodobacter sp. CCB-MM2 TaxID=1786003 RepID=UPI00082FA9B9|nr:cytochrome c biogenesis protein CcdA [Pararhodobacter sp. CCB-MM2]
MFGIDLFDAALMPSLMVALVAGLLSFLSPCVLPIVPPYLAYMSGISMRDLTESRGISPATVPALFFVMGLSTVFLFLGFTASSLGRLFLAYREEFAMVAGVVVMVMGLHFLGLFKLGFLMREARFEGGKGGSAFGAYVLGLAFAFGWTPCIGPILGMIITLAATEESIARGTGLLAAYAVGLGLPFLLAAVFITRAIGFMNRLKPWMGIIEKVMGALLVLVGLALITGWLADFSFWLLDMFPALGRIG